MGELPTGRIPADMPADSRSNLSGVAFDPTSYLPLLKHVDSSIRVDRQTIAGVSATHWTTIVNIQQLLTSHSPDLTSFMAFHYNRISDYSSTGLTDLTNVPVDVWIDDTGRIRRLIVTTRAASDPAVSSSVTFTFTKFGAAPVAAPPKSRTIPASKQNLQALAG